MTICSHCKMDIELRNPSGYCDHLYYPYNCKICSGISEKEEMSKDSIKMNEHLHYLKILKSCSSVYQPEIRNALDYAIEIISKQENDSK